VKLGNCGKSQFISFLSTCWATLALLEMMAEKR
jgi:hypothetical protein